MRRTMRGAASGTARWALAWLACAAGCGTAQGPAFPEGMPPLKQPPPDAVGGFTIQLPQTTLMPGEEVQPCYIFPLVVDGPSRIVGGATLNTAPGLHHGNITTRPSTGDGIRTCPNDGNGSEAFDVIAGGSVLFASSTQHSGEEWISFPEGMGYRVKEGYEIVARVHYLNAATTPIVVAPSYQWFTIDEAKVTEELAPFVWDYQKFMLPPHQTTTVLGDCPFPYPSHPMHIVEALPHMHKMGVGFTAGVTGGPLDGQSFLESKGYDPDKGVLVQYSPAVDLSGVDGITFACTWNNTTDATLTYGIGLNEMCMMFGYAYPISATYSALAGSNACVMTTVPQ